MPELIEDSRKFGVVANSETKSELDFIHNIMNNLRQNLQVDLSVSMGSNERENTIFRSLYSDLYREDEWSELIRTLRIADDDIHHLRFTNMYIEHHLSAYYEDVKEIKKASNLISDRLNELSRFEVEFNRAASSYLSSVVPEESKKLVKNVKFGRIPRKSKSAADSVNKICMSYGLVQDNELSWRDKLARKKNLRKYCPSCEAIELSSQNSVMRCCDCDGEIIVQGLCSSCDSFKGRLIPKQKRRNDKIADKACSTCDFLRKKRICWDDKKICNKCKKGKNKTRERACVYEDKYIHLNAVAPRLVNYVEASSCSDCDLTSSCDASLSGYKHKYRVNDLSVDSLVPLSDSDNVIQNVRSYSQDYDLSSSISSSTMEIRKDSPKLLGSVSPILKITQSAHEPLSRVAEETMSTEEEFISPREYFSAEDLTLGDTEHSQENTLIICQNNKNKEEKVIIDVNSNRNGKTTDSEEYIEAIEPYDDKERTDVTTEGVTISSEALLGDVVSQQPDLFAVSDRLHKAEEALAYITEGGTKLKAGILAIENISQQNWKLSVILQEIMLDIASQLDYVHCSRFNNENINAEEESDNSAEFEEALEDVYSSVKADSDSETFYDIPTPNHMYLCIECGIETSYEPLIKCLTCNRTLTEIPNGVLNEELSLSVEIDSSKILKNLSLNTLTPTNYQKNEVEELKRAAFPSVFVKRDFLSFSLLDLESRLKHIEKETSLLNNNNDVISLLIDELKKKTTVELKSIKDANALENGADPETTVFGIDVSIYQYRRLIAERLKSTETIVEASGEEVCQRNRTFLEMKFEEVFKKEQQTALELEVFEQKLQIEGLIIKEMEDYFTCSSSSQAVEKIDDKTTYPHWPFALTRFTSEKFQTSKAPMESDELLISIEIEVEKESKDCEKKAVRCEYKANLQRNTLRDQSYMRKAEYDRVLPIIACPMWTSSMHIRKGLNRESSSESRPIAFRCSSLGLGKLQNVHSDGFHPSEPYFMDFEHEDLVEIKAPNFFYGSSDEETESCGGDSGIEKRRRKFHSVAAVRMPVAMYPVMEIRMNETPFAILNSNRRTTCQKREFSKISQIELEESPQSGVIFVQTKAVSSLGITECSSIAEGSFEEFYEAKSQSFASDMTLHRSGRSTWGNCSSDSILWKEMTTKRQSSCMVKFIPINMGGSSVASITLLDETLPVLITENRKHIEEFAIKNKASTSSQFKMKEKELTRALSLIREIENDVIDVKLHNAIEILPQLESILREHLQQKIEVLKKKSSTMTNASLDVFMSSLNFITEYTEESTPSERVPLEDSESDERLGKMLQLLTGLEQAVRQINTTEKSISDCRNNDAGRIYDLLEALSSRIKGTVGEPNLSEMEKTLELTSDLDVAIRDYSSEIYNMSAASQDSFERKSASVRNRSSFVAADKLKTLKKNIFEAVADEAQGRETRIERDFERVSRLERENAEVMRFLDTLLDKTLRRVGELDEIKGMIYALNRCIKELEILEMKKVEAKPVIPSEHEMPQTRMVKMGRTPTLPSIQEVSSDNRTSESSEEDKCESMKDTLTDMIVALDTLKSKAKEKGKRYKEIFGEETCIIHKSLPFSDKSNSSLVKQGGSASITQFNRIGANTYYMTWSKPDIADEDGTITGYEIWVNGRVNQRVRNPERLKTVLYSVDSANSEERFKIKLFALTDSNRRLSLADLKYP